MSTPFSTADTIRFLLRRKWLVIITAAVTSVGAYVYALFMPEYYKATINCVPPTEDAMGLGGALGGISSTLKDIGLSKIGGKSADSYEFIALLFSRSIRDSMITRFNLVEEYEMEKQTRQEVLEEFDKNMEVDFKAEGNYEISFWSRDRAKSVEMCRQFVIYANDIKNKVKRMEAQRSVDYMQRRVAALDSVLSVLTDSLSAYSKAYRIFSPMDQATASAKALAESKAELLKQETIYEVLGQNFGADDPQVRATKAIVDRLKVQYEEAQTLPGFAGNFALTDATGIAARYLRMYADFEAHTKLKAFLLPTLEQTRLDLNRTSSALLVVDEPTLAEKRDRPKRLFIAAGSGIGAGVLVILLLLSVRAWKSMLSVSDE